MIKPLFRMSLAAAALAAGATVALSADLLPPPPPEELRPATYDWSGPYVGGFVSAVSLEGHYDKFPDCPCPPVDPEMSGTGFNGGVFVGWNHDLGGAVFGIEGDWGWGGEIADNEDPAELTELSFDNIATLRARAGIPIDNVMIYATGGAAFVEAEFEGEVGPVGASFHSRDEEWITGWTIGGGIEAALTDGLHARLEYLYIDLPDEDFRLEDPNGFGGDVDMHFDGIHAVRAGISYNFML